MVSIETYCICTSWRILGSDYLPARWEDLKCKYLAVSQDQTVGQMEKEDNGVEDQTTHLPLSSAVARQLPTPATPD